MSKVRSRPSIPFLPTPPTRHASANGTKYQIWCIPLGTRWAGHYSRKNHEQIPNRDRCSDLFSSAVVKACLSLESQLKSSESEQMSVVNKALALRTHPGRPI